MPFLAQAADVVSNPILGILLFTFGGLTGAVFYLPFRKVQGWAWESYWLVYAVFGLIVVPWLLTLIVSRNVLWVLLDAPPTEIGYCFVCGALWGVGALTYGLTIRYLGVGLGLAVALGLCSATGTLIPPMLKGEFTVLTQTAAGVVSLAAVLISLLGIVLVGGAGMSKESELPEAAKKAAVAEFAFKKGLCVAILCGLTSSGMSFGLQGGETIKALAGKIEPVTYSTWKGMPVLMVTLAGGVAVEIGYCLYLNFKNRTGGDYRNSACPLLANLCFAGLAGVIWSPQLICLTAGESAMGRISYLGWSVLLTSLILFSTGIGILLGEWKSTSNRTRTLLVLGLLCLVASSVTSCYSGYLGSLTK